MKPNQSDELNAIRNELLIRIFLQNATLLLAVVAFAVISCVLVFLSSHRPMLVFLHSCVLLALSVQWCHHGVRTMQIKKYILLVEESCHGNTWEKWLPQNRPKTLLGSRWLISTKGVLLGLQAAMLTPVIVDDPAFFWMNLYIQSALLIIAVTASLLLTNPKE